MKHEHFVISLSTSINKCVKEIPNTTEQEVWDIGIQSVILWNGYVLMMPWSLWVPSSLQHWDLATRVGVWSCDLVRGERRNVRQVKDNEM